MQWVLEQLQLYLRVAPEGNPGQLSLSEQWDGTSWTEGNDLTIAWAMVRCWNIKVIQV